MRREAQVKLSGGPLDGYTAEVDARSAGQPSGLYLLTIHAGHVLTPTPHALDWVSAPEWHAYESVGDGRLVYRADVRDAMNGRIVSAAQ